MKPAPAFDCVICARRIGKNRSHHLINYPDVTADRVLCSRCMLDTRRLHARFYPACGERWHDLHDHPSGSATRAAAAQLLGLWP